MFKKTKTDATKTKQLRSLAKDELEQVNGGGLCIAGKPPAGQSTRGYCSTSSYRCC